MNRSTVLGRALRRGDVDAARAEVLESLEITLGNVRRASARLNISRRQLIRLLERVNLWPELDAIRERAAKEGITPWTKRF